MDSIQEKIELQIKKGSDLKREIELRKSQGIITDLENYLTDVQNLDLKVSNWKSYTLFSLNIFNENLTALKIDNIYEHQGFLTLLEKDRLSIHIKFLRNSIDILIGFLDDIKRNKSDKEIKVITIDDIDNFKPFLSNVTDSIDEKYFQSAFLEDDVENAFLKILKEPYKENDSGAETRDMFTNNIKYKGERLYSAMMFKGRGLKTELNLTNAGKNGNQLLKLAKNSSAQLFLVQHVNKINPEVIETLKDHLLSYSQFKTVYICAVNGQDTARVLLSLGLDLDELMGKEDNRGRKTTANRVDLPASKANGESPTAATKMTNKTT